MVAYACRGPFRPDRKESARVEDAFGHLADVSRFPVLVSVCLVAEREEFNEHCLATIEVDWDGLDLVGRFLGAVRRDDWKKIVQLTETEITDVTERAKQMVVDGS